MELQGSICNNPGGSRTAPTQNSNLFWPPFSWICARRIVYNQPHIRAVQEKGRER